MAVTAGQPAAQNPAYRPASHCVGRSLKPDSEHLWRGPRWALALLLAGLSMVGPFAVDTYLPAFEGIAGSLQATPVQMQQTLSGYLLAFGLMNLFHGSLSDSLGRRPLVLAGTGVFALASLGCALAPNFTTLLVFRVLQGMSAGAGMVVARAIIRDLYAPADAQRAMSQVTIFFGIAPVVAPLVGGVVYEWAGWRAIFVVLTLLGAAFWLANLRWLPETLPPAARQPLRVSSLLKGYVALLKRPRLWGLLLASSLPFNAFFLYVLAAPAFLGELLGLPPTAYALFFACTAVGIMGGAFVSGRLAGQLAPHRQILLGGSVMALAMALHVAVQALLPPHPLTHMPLLGLYSFGWSLLTPVVTILALDQAPERRGMVSSLQTALGNTTSALVAGVLIPLVMHSLVGLALASAALWAAGALAWWCVRSKVGVPSR